VDTGSGFENVIEPTLIYGGSKNQPGCYRCKNQSNFQRKRCWTIGISWCKFRWKFWSELLRTTYRYWIRKYTRIHRNKLALWKLCAGV